ncbi:MAG: transporter substrate-binding domain-containing protein, partial [Hoeflea sp.]|nr:transporter substrate-binding domain-containing protein [Hoeflea sp.]
VGSMSITEERLKTIDFSDKYYNTPSVIATAKGSGITPDDAGLKGKIIGVQVSTIHQDYVTTHFGDVAAEIKEYQTQDEANQDLAAGRVDAIMADSLALDAFVKSDACCEVVGAVEDDPAILGAGVGVGLRKGDDALREKFNTAIAAIRENGTYAEFSKKYFDFDIYGQ